jgi:hypothetical protein
MQEILRPGKVGNVADLGDAVVSSGKLQTSRKAQIRRDFILKMFYELKDV